MVGLSVGVVVFDVLPLEVCGGGAVVRIMPVSCGGKATGLRLIDWWLAIVAFWLSLTLFHRVCSGCCLLLYG